MHDKFSLYVDEISHKYNDRLILKNISFKISNSEIVCLVGPSGCGKSSILRLIAGLEKLQKGKILLSGKVVSGQGTKYVPPEDRNIGFVFQDLALFPHLNVLENVKYGIKKNEYAVNHKIALELLRNVKLEAHLKSYPHTLSGGEQQRVALVRALATDPKLMLLDEPFSDLDPQLRISIREEIIAILKESKITTLMVTHDPKEAMLMADKLIVMNKGKLVQQGSASEIYYNPINKFVAGFFSDINVLQGFIENDKVRFSLGEITIPTELKFNDLEVVIRNEGFFLSKERKENFVRADVLNCRPLGSFSCIKLRLEADRSEITANVTENQVPVVGSKVWVGFDEALTFLFNK